MPRRTELFNHHIAVHKGQEPETAGETNGGSALVDVWTLIFTDRVSGDQVAIGFRREARDEVVRLLTGGVVLAGGDLPQV